MIDQFNKITEKIQSSLRNFKSDYQIDKAQFEAVFQRMDALEQGHQGVSDAPGAAMEIQLQKLMQKLEEHREWVVERLNKELVQVKEELKEQFKKRDSELKQN